MVSELEIAEALSLDQPIIDVRSPSEYAKGHIPSAVNIPLFSDSERAEVGTVYKQDSREAAVKLGYEFVNPKLQSFIVEALKIAPDGRVIVHCWRGGMRSRAFAQHLADHGLDDVKVIVKGYKAYRNYVLDSMSVTYKLKVLGGYTGSGKTYILDELKKLGEQVIDLEGLANHKGSAFGGIDQPEQPSAEHFENLLFTELDRLDKDKPIWLEDECHQIGRVKIPMPLYEQMRNSVLYFVDIPKTIRAKHLVDGYADCDKEELAYSISKIEKRLGGLNMKNSIEYIESKKYYEAAILMLDYYDKSYSKGMNKRDISKRITLSLDSTNHYINAVKLKEL